MRISDWSSDVCSSDLAAAVVASDRESNQRDLFEAIERGDFPKWKLYIQVMPETDAEKVPYHPFDLTKVWPKGDYPLIEVGEFELNKNPENSFADVEQAAFAPGNLDRKSVVSGKRVSVSVDLGGRRIIQKKTRIT